MPVLKDAVELFDGQRWDAPPTWAEFLASLGWETAALRRKHGWRTHAAVVVPTLGYATAFVACGAVLAKATLSGEGTDGDPFGHLRPLTIGAPVTVQELGKLKKGFFQGIETIAGVERAGVQVESKKGGGLTLWKPAVDVGAIQPAEDADWTLPASQSGKAIKGDVQTIAALLGRRAMNFIGGGGDIGCVIVGRKEQIRDELEGVSIRPAAASGEGGTLLDVVRTRELGMGQTYRSAWCASTGEGSERFLELDGVAVFNGARNFVQGFDAWSDRSWIAVLGRTEPALEEATQLVEQAYFMCGGQPVTLWDGAAVPRGVEVFIFRATVT